MENKKQTDINSYNKLYILIFLYVLSFGITIFNIVARLGFTIDYLKFFSLLGFALFAFNLLWFAELLKKKNQLFFNFTYLLLVFLLSIVLLSYLPFISVILFYTLSFLGFLGATYILFFFILRKINIWAFLFTVAISSFFTLWLLGLMYSLNYITSLFLEELSQGIADQDTLFHMSIAQMFKTYGISSTGQDGIPYVAYHYGSHWLFARLSYFSGYSIVDMYHLLYPILLIPLYFQVLLTAVVAIAKHYQQPLSFNTLKWQGLLFWLLFLIIHIGVLPLEYLRKFALFNSYVFSQSYLLSLIFLFMAIKVLLDIVNAQNSKSHSVLSLKLVLGFLVVCMLFSKISVGLLVIPALAYLQFRHHQYFRLPNLLLWGGGFVVFYAIFKLTSEGNIIKFEFLHFLHNYTDVSFWYYFLPFYFILLLVYILIRVQKESRLANSQKFLELFQNRKITDVEVMVLVALASLLPGILLSIAGGSAGYFSDVPRKLSVVLFLSLTPVIYNLLHTKMYNATRVLLLICLFIPISLSLLSNTKNHLQKMLANRINIRYAITGYDTNIRKTYSGIQAKINKNPKYQFIKKLDSLDKLAIEDKQNLLVNVPHSDTLFYNLAEAKPWASSFIIPALTGIASINGLPAEKTIKDYDYYGFSIYHKRNKVPLVGSDKTKKLKQRAKALGVADKRILKLSIETK